MLTFQKGARYTRPDVKERAGLSRSAKGGNWDTGIVECDKEFVIFTNIGTEGRTGHHYGNRWEGSRLRWYHKGNNILDSQENRPYILGMDSGNGPETLLEAIQFFSDPDRALAFMAELRWPNGKVTCPTCGSDRVRFIETRRLWACREVHPKQQFSIKVGTVMEDSPIGLDKWLPAFWLITNCKNGISSYELARNLDVTQKTAWFMLHRIRLAMQAGSNGNGRGKMSGEVEVDETFIGGRARFMHADRRRKTIHGTGPSGKAAVMGLLERHGKDGHSTVRVKVVEDRKRRTLDAEVHAHVEPGAHVFTDELKSYDALGFDYTHKVINHAECYAIGNVHTNGMENFWSLLKRGIKGTYVAVEPFHLFLYLDEQAFRFNARKANDGSRFVAVLRDILGKRLTYQSLIGADLSPATT